MTNSLITEARRLDAARTGQRTAVGFTSAQFATHWYTDTADFIAFAANHILAFADKIEELRAQVEELHSSRNHLFGTVKELRVRDANALTVIEQLRSEVKTLRNQDVMLSEQNTKLREALAEIAGACLSFVESTGVPISDEAREQLRKALGG